MSTRDDRHHPWDRVADAVTARTSELVMTQAEVVRISGLSDPTIRSLMTGKLRATPTPITIGRLERALQWQPGSVQRILDGGDPLPVQPSVMDGDLANELRAEIERLRASVERLTDELHGVRSSDHQPSGK